MAIYKLEDIAIIKNGTTPSTKNKNLWLKEIPFFGPSDLNNMKPKRYITKNINNLKRPGTTLISSTATIGNIGFLKIESWFNQQITSIEPNNNFLLDKYLYYYFLKNSKKIKNMKDGGSIFTILKISVFKNWKFFLPSLKTQKQIIDIIEPYEKLFLSYSQCVRIDNISNTKKDIKNLIDIIEPFEKLKNKYKLIKKKIKNLLINEYNKKENKYINLSEIIIKKTQKRSKQNLYFQTNGILELNIDFSKMINLNKINKIPSRANLVPKDNSILFSKLLGENKILPWFYEKENEYVFSTGFYNIQSKNLDHILSFLLTNDFKRKKTMFANGTTMIGINDNSIKNIKIKKSYENSNVFSKFIFKLIFIESKINKIKNKILKLLIE